MLNFGDFPFDPAFLAYACSDDGAKLIGDDTAILLPHRTPVGFVRGDASRAADLLTALLDDHVFQTRPRVILSVPDAAWRDAIKSSPKLSVRIIPRVDFRHGSEIPDSRDLPAGIELAPLDDSIVERVRDCDPEFDASYFRSMHGFGWAAMDDAKIVSIGWAPALAGWAEIGVATVASHRSRGLARAVGAATVEEALLRNLKPHASTNQQNAAAKAWARSLGFTSPVEHHWIVLTPR